MTALRVFRRAPGYVAAVVAMLAIGTGFLVAIFSLVDATLFRPPPFPDVDRIVMLFNIHSTPRAPESRQRWSFAWIGLLRRLAPDLGIIANYSPSLLTLTEGGVADAVPGEIVSPEYFRLLGAAPVLGRTFMPSEDSVAGAHPVAVLGHGLWRQRFGGDSAILGRAVRINGHNLTVIGVLGPGFHGLTGTSQLWIPTTMAPVLTYPEYLTSPQQFISLVARLSPRLSLEAARARLGEVGAGIVAASPDPDTDPDESIRTTAIPLNQARVSDTTRRSLQLLFIGASLLYALAAANVVNLMLGRTVARRREAAILLALGGTSWRRGLHFAAEGAILVLLGCVTGIGLAWLLGPLFQVPPESWGPRTLYGSLSPFSAPGFGLRPLLFGGVLTLASITLLGLVPVAVLSRSSTAMFLREGSGASRPAGSLRRPSLRGLIVAAETALAMMLLVAGGLMLESFRRILATDLGVKPDRVLAFWVRPSEASVPVDQAPAFVTRLLAELKTVPGVEAVSVDGGAPVSGSARSSLIIARRPPADLRDAPPILRHYVAPDHFKVLGVPLLRGRLFNDGDDAGSPRVVIISQTAAEKFWPGQDPIGERVWFGGGSSFDSPERSGEIVGVVGDVAYEPLDVRNNRASFYTPYRQFTYGARVVLVRAAGDPMALVGPLRKALTRVDPDLPMVDVQPLSRQIGNSWARQRFDALIFGGFALVGLLLAGLGVYSVVAFAVAQRTREMGIRLALGAQRRAVLALVVREGMVFPLAGLVAGVAGAIGVSRLLRASLYQVSPGDPRVALLAVGIIVLVAVLACCLPARRATAVDPALTLRAE